MNPNDYIAYMNRGWNKAQLLDHYAAISDYNKSIIIESNYALAYLNRGYSKQEIEDHKGAISDLMRQLKLIQKNAWHI